MNLKILCLVLALLIISQQSNDLEAKRVQSIDDVININSEYLHSETTYQKQVNQQLTLDYEVDLNAYSIQLDEVTSEGLKSLKTLQRKEEEGDVNNQLIYEDSNGCTAYKRDFFIEQLQHFTLQHGHISDLIVLPEKQKIYVLTEQYILIQGEFTLIKINDHEKTIHTEFVQSIDFSNELKQISSQDDLSHSNTFGFVDSLEEYVYIVTQFGALKFDTSKDIESDEFVLEQLNFDHGNEIIDIQTYKNFVFVILGEKGLDIYEVDPVEHNFIKVRNLESELKKNSNLEGYQIDIRRVVVNMDVMAVLDVKNGIFFYNVKDIKNISHSQKVMDLRLTGMHSFDYRGNTMIIVFTGRVDKVWEIFLNFEKKQYYVNRVYLDEVTYTDVRMDRHFAILQSDSAHRIISHSVYKQFSVSSLWKRHRYFSQLSLKFLVILNYVEETDKFFVQKRSYYVANQLQLHKTTFLLGAGGIQLSVQQIDERHAQIRCKSSEKLDKRYQITINSTSCDLQNVDGNSLGNVANDQDDINYKRNIINPFQQCQRVFNFTFLARENLVQTEDVPMVAGFLIGLCFFIMFIGCFLFFNYRFALRRKREAQKRWEDMTYKQNMSNVIKDIPNDVQNNNNQQQQQQQNQQQQIQEQNQDQQEQQQKPGTNFQIDDDEEDNNVKYGLEDQ